MRFLGRRKKIHKDREQTFDVVPGKVQIMLCRTSSMPIVYAVMLRVMRNGSWETVVVADNTHEHDGKQTVAPHHYHEYIDGEKQEGKPLPFQPKDVNEAMSGVMKCFRSNWKEFATP